MAAPGPTIRIPRWIQLVGLPVLAVLAYLLASTLGHALFLFLAAAVLWFFVATGLGALWAVLQIVPASFGFTIPLPFSIEFEIVFNPARVLSGFENTLVYGWLTNAGIAALLFIAPRLVFCDLRPVSISSTSRAAGPSLKICESR